MRQQTRICFLFWVLFEGSIYVSIRSQDSILVLLTLNLSAMLALRAGNWRGASAPPLGHDPQGKVLGILGMGGIGRNLMKKAAAFGMTTQYYNRTELSEELSGGAKYVSFEELIKTSDVLSLNLPLNVSLLCLSSTPPLNDTLEQHSPHHLIQRI
jgi:lactate dehydrogenase-like 2-hydroxyacid dehydrogenase